MSARFLPFHSSRETGNDREHPLTRLDAEQREIVEIVVRETAPHDRAVRDHVAAVVARGLNGGAR